MKSYYNILGIDPSASIDEIKAAYRRKAKEYHPDVSKLENTNQLFIEATEAYEFLIRARSAAQKKVFDEASAQRYYVQWQRYTKPQANERAKHFSRMRYNDFKKTQYYKATQTANEIYVYISLGVSVFIIVSAIYGFMADLYDPETKPVQYVGDVSIFILGLIFLFFSLYQMVDLIHEKRKDAEDRSKK